MQIAAASFMQQVLYTTCGCQKLMRHGLFLLMSGGLACPHRACSLTCTTGCSLREVEAAAKRASVPPQLQVS